MEQHEIGTAVETVFRNLMSDRGTPVAEVDATRDLYERGYGLDSMDTATLSAMLDERFEGDPYSTGGYPRTLAEIVTYYASQPVAG